MRSKTGSLSIETAEPVPGPHRTQLKTIGVKGRRPAEFVADQFVNCWAEFLPLETMGGVADSKGQFLFELTPAENWKQVSLELLRQGNSEQGLRLVDLGDGRTQAYLRVDNPGLYTLLRSASPEDGMQFRVFRPGGTGIWIEWGYRHPLENQIPRPTGQLMMIPAHSSWYCISDSQFRSFTDVAELQLPSALETLHDLEVTDRLEIPLRLRTNDQSPAAEGWMIDGEHVEQLEQFVATASSNYLHGLAFAAAEVDGRRHIFLRRRPGLTGAPVFVFPTQQFYCDPRMPSLLVPVGRSLSPPVAPSLLADLLGARASQQTWLVPCDADDFRSSAIPEAAFRPLSTWVDYVITNDSELIQDWIDRSVFDLQIEVGDTTAPRAMKRRSKPRSPDANDSSMDEPESTPDKLETDADVDSAPNMVANVRPATQTATDLEAISKDEGALVTRVLNRMKQRRASQSSAAAPSGTQADLTTMKLPASERAQFWLQYSQTLAEEGQAVGAELAWLAAAWDTAAETSSDDKWPPDAGSALNVTELKESGALEPARRSHRSHVLNQCRSFLAENSRAPSMAAESLNAASLVELETHLPVRASWMCWKRLHANAEADLLLVSRARERLIKQVDRSGLRIQREFPPLASGPLSENRGNGTSVVRQRWLDELAEKIRAWSKPQRSNVETDATDTLIQMLHAWGIAFTGSPEKARELWDSASANLNPSSDLQKWLGAAMRFRIETAEEEQLTLLPELSESLDKLPRMERYKVDRLIQNLSILAGGSVVDPFRRYVQMSPEQSLSESSIDSISEELNKLVEETQSGKKLRPEEVLAVLKQSSLLEENDAATCFQIAVENLETVEEPRQASQLMASLMRLSVGIRDAEWADQLATRIPEVLQNVEIVREHESADWLQFGAESTRFLNRQANWPALEATADELERLGTLLGPPAGWDHDDSIRFDPLHLVGLQMLLHAAIGRTMAGQSDSLSPTLDSIQQFLKSPRLNTAQKAIVGRLYISAVGLLPGDEAWLRLLACFDSDGLILKDSYTTASDFSLSHLMVAEAAIQSLVGDRFGLSREWLDWLDAEEDEIRHRIQSEFRRIRQESA